jgi:hypothetical protein
MARIGSAEPTLTNESYTGLFFGLASGLVFLLVHRWLPAGWVGGLAYGVLLLVVAGTRLEPLGRDNPDFDLVGPGAFGGGVCRPGNVPRVAGRRPGREA